MQSQAKRHCVGGSSHSPLWLMQEHYLSADPGISWEQIARNMKTTSNYVDRQWPTELQIPEASRMGSSISSSPRSFLVTWEQTACLQSPKSWLQLLCLGYERLSYTLCPNFALECSCCRLYALPVCLFTRGGSWEEDQQELLWLSFIAFLYPVRGYRRNSAHVILISQCWGLYQDSNFHSESH